MMRQIAVSGISMQINIRGAILEHLLKIIRNYFSKFSRKECILLVLIRITEMQLT